MRLSEAIKPISYLKSHAAEIINHFEENSTPVIITQNGRAKAVLQDIREYEEMQESITMLKLLLIGKADIEAGRTKPLKKAFEDIRKKMKEKYGE
jgi:prevent-host-death family protein